MKYLYIKIKVLLTSLILFSACDTDLDINRDPDLLAPSEIPISAQIPTSITGIAAAAGTFYAIPGGIWSQFFTQSSAANQYRTIDDYSLVNSSSFVNTGWSQIYDALTDIRNVKTNAELESNWNYFLIATTLEVYASQLLVDFYENIPYSEANDTSILNPAFQSSDEVYDLMVADLKSALAKDFSISPVENAPGNEDLIFSGNIDNWKKFANTLLLKLYLRQSNARPTIAETGITSLINSGVLFLDQAAALNSALFSDEAGRSNPLYENERRQLNVGTNLRASSTLGTYLESNNDTRLPEYYDGTTFQEQGDFENGSSTTSLPVLNYNDPFYFITEAESYFLQAEARVRYFGGTGAQAMYDAGVTAAFSRWGLDPSAFITTGGAYAYPNGTEQENIETIILQKWVDMFPGSGFESFIEQNRTGYPQLSSVATSDPTYIPGQYTYSVEGTTNGLLPRRFEYPSDELSRNSNAPTELIDITVKTWYAN